MPFLKAGFNGRNHDTGIRGFTCHVRSNRRKVAPAELRRFACGDYFWYGDRGPGKGGFIAWGECVVIASHEAFKRRTGLPQSRLP